MKDSKRQKRENGRKRPDDDPRDESLAEVMAGYTPKQRETLLKGFRILAKVAVRAHMERQASATRGAPDDGGEEKV